MTGLGESLELWIIKINKKKLGASSSALEDFFFCGTKICRVNNIIIVFLYIE